MDSIIDADVGCDSILNSSFWKFESIYYRSFCCRATTIRINLDWEYISMQIWFLAARVERDFFRVDFAWMDRVDILDNYYEKMNERNF